MKHGLASFIFLVWLPCCLFAREFIIRDIRVEGLERVSVGSVLADLPVTVGDRFDEARAPDLIKALYRTGYFDDVEVARRAETLIITVEERPGIASITLIGNKQVADELLIEALKEAGVAAGKVYDRHLLERVAKQLAEQYQALGRFGARIDAEVRELAGNQVHVNISVDEGEISKIREFRILGNRKITDKALFKRIESGATHWYEFWSGKDDYSRAKLMGDLEALHTMYYNRGYLDFKITATRVSISADKRDIYVTLTVDEGERYRIDDIDLSYRLPVKRALLQEKIMLRKGTIFSRADAVRSSEAIEFALKDAGYASAQVTAIPDTNPEERTVDVAFVVTPGSRTYVRRVNFHGNDGTSDEVFRRELRQLEGAEYSAGKIELSRRRLQRLPYIRQAAVETRPVEGRDDQVDVDINLVEAQSGRFNLGAGYSDEEGAVLTLSLHQENFRGTGNRVGFAFNNSSANTNYMFSFLNPFYTLDGVSRSWSFAYRAIDNSERDINDTKTREARVRLGFGIPLSENDTLHVGAALQEIKVSPGAGIGSRLRDYYEGQCGWVERFSAGSFVRDIEDCDFLNLVTSVEMDYDTRNRALFPTDGTRIRGNVQFFIPIDGLAYYKADYYHRHYAALDENTDYVFAGKLRVSYADKYGETVGVPPYDRFFAGGTNSLRGYLSNSLGPRDDNDDPLGGDFRLLLGADLFFPTDFLYDRNRLRVSAFTDYGNVFSGIGDLSLSDMRGSYGLQVYWLTAVGGISFNFASHFQDEPNDDTESFQFNIGSSF